VLQDTLSQASRSLGSSMWLGAKLKLVSASLGTLPNSLASLVRGRFYRAAGLHVHPTAHIMGDLELTGMLDGVEAKLNIGPRASVGYNVTINLDAEVEIGPDASIGPFVRIYTGTHPIGPGSSRRNPALLARPVRIEKGAWIGLGAMVLPGVTVGEGSIVAAGAVVTQNVPPHTCVEGNPAKVVRELPWRDR